MEPDKSKSPLTAQDISQQESNPAMQPSNDYQSPTVDPKLFPVKRSKILTATYVFSAIIFIAFLSGMASQSPDYVTYMQYLVLFVGILLAITLGVHSAQQVARGIKYREHYGGHASKMFIAGYILVIISFFTGGLSLIPGLIMLYIAINRKKNTTPSGPGKHTNTFLKVLYIFLGFIGGALPAVLVSLFGAYMLWNHWCDLTSSKCL